MFVDSNSNDEEENVEDMMERVEGTAEVTTATAAVREAIKLNNEGVSNLLQGNNDAVALQELTQALRKIQVVMRDTQKSTEAEEEEEETLATSATNFVSSTLCKGELSSLQDDFFYVFNKPLLLSHPPMDDESVMTTSMFSTYSAVIMLNIALAYHRIGQDNGCVADLKKSQEIYRIIVSFLTPRRQRGGGRVDGGDGIGGTGTNGTDFRNTDATAWLVLTAALNNLSHIQWCTITSRDDDAESQMTSNLSYLRVLMLQEVQWSEIAHHNNYILDRTNEQWLDGMMMNAFLWNECNNIWKISCHDKFARAA